MKTGDADPSGDQPLLGTGARPAPLGFDEPFPWEADAQEPLVRRNSTAHERAGIAPQSSGSFLKSIAFGHGAPTSAGGAQAAPVPEPERADPAKKSSGIVDVIRDKLSTTDIDQIKTMMFDPSLALTIPQREVLGRVSRYGELGDKAGIKRSVMDLVERLDVSSPKNGAVLVAGTLGANASPVLGQQLPLGALDPGKRTVDMTQGGQTLTRLIPILGNNGAFRWNDGMDRGWGRLNERFAQHADGVVDVVVDAPKSPAPVGQWTTGGAPGAKAPVGEWSTGAASPDKAPVGEWSVPASPAPGGAAAGAEPPAGTWTLPDPKSGGNPTAGPIGTWQTAPQASGASGAGADSIGAWTTPKDAPADSPAANVGEWKLPDASAKAGEGAADQIGRWSADKQPVGQWSSATDPASQAPVGQWSVPGQGASPTPGSPGAPVKPGAPAAAPRVAGGPPQDIAVWSTSKDLPVTKTMNLGDIIRQNPKIAGLRILQIVQPGAGGAGGLQQILSASRASLGF